MFTSNSHSSLEAQLPRNTNRRTLVNFLAWRGFRRLRSGGALLTLLALILTSLAVADVTTPEEVTSRWSVVGTQKNTRVEHKPATQDRETVQRFRLLNARLPEEVQIRTPLTPSMVHNDYTASVRIHSSVIGIQLGLLLVLPNQTDPRTGRPLEIILPGEKLSAADQWQTLRVEATKKAIEAQTRRVRAELNSPDIRIQQALITGLVLYVEATPGEIFFDLGAVTSGPTITPAEPLLKLVSGSSVDSSSSHDNSRFIPVDVELGGLMLDHKPVVLRMAPDHAEHIETLKQIGLNSVWVPDSNDQDRAKSLYEAGIAVVATPPHPEFEPGDYTRIVQSLPPLDQQYPHVSAWLTGNRVSPEEQPHLLAWSREVRSADRKYQRLQMADVTGAEGSVAREIDLVGIGRHVVGRDISFGSLRNLLIRRQQNAGQISCPWTWVQTEPSALQRAWREDLGLRQTFLEPEQIQQGVYTALSAGYKGIGFWKTHALQIDNSADRETAIAIELACMEIELLERFLARGRIEGYLALQKSEQKSASRNRDTKSRLNSALGGRTAGAAVAGTEGPLTHDAVVINGNGNTLILATAWDNVSQFVPGPLFEPEVNLIVAASETSSAWQISTTGISGLPRDVTAGGLSLKIRNFDQSAALVICSNPAALIPGLEKQIHAMAPRAAARTTELASLKYLRVLETLEHLRDEHTVSPQVDGLMSQSKQMLDRAEFELKNQDFHEAAQRARDSMRYARLAQQECWKMAIENLTSPTSSPHTISFATLPDHWRLMHYIEQQQHRITDNLLPSGDFENLRSASQEGWSLSLAPKSPCSATADVLQDPRAGKILRLIAWYANAEPNRLSKEDAMPITVTTPPIEVNSGDVMLISGRVRKGRTASPESKRPLVIFDSELGPENSVRTELESEWTRFEMIRPISSSTSFSVTMGLMGHSGVEEAHIDDLTIRRIPSLQSSEPMRLTGDKKSLPLNSPE
jgi:hypothetical protein